MIPYKKRTYNVIKHIFRSNLSKLKISSKYYMKNRVYQMQLLFLEKVRCPTSIREIKIKKDMFSNPFRKNVRKNLIVRNSHF